MNFEVLEHTADIGFRAWGSTFEEMLSSAAMALVAIAMEVDDIDPREPYPIAAQGEDRESLVVNWLNEVLYLVDGRLLALRRVEMKECSETAVSGVAWGEPHTEKHRAKLIVKGVTYHQLKVEPTANGWFCEVYLDI